MPQAMNTPNAKTAVDKEWKKLETTPAWQLEKVKCKRDVILEAQKDKTKDHFATLMDICHFENAELEPKLQKYQGRVVHRSDTVKKPLEPMHFFTEQGSSASQMIAAKVMDVIARIPDCDGQAADAVSAYTQVKWRTNAQNSKVRGYVFHDKNGLNHVQTLKIQWYLSNEICMDTH